MQLNSTNGASDSYSAAHALMGGLIDYAGLFPPAKLDMASAIRNYANYLKGSHAWMLGRFILPVSRIEEFRKASQGFLPTNHSLSNGDADSHGWLISALIDGDLEENIDSIFVFNHEHSRPSSGLALIDAVEIKIPAGPESPQMVDDALETMPEELYPFFEVPILPTNPGQTAHDYRGIIAALSGADAAAKIRTGGITQEAFPAPSQVAEFLLHCAAADVPFKATAGLHHAVRAHYPLTYEPNCPKGLMHGFLNVFLAAILAKTHSKPCCALEALSQILAETDPQAFNFGQSLISWNGFGITLEEIETARESFALSYGSCSFTEPVEELRRLGVID